MSRGYFSAPLAASGWCNFGAYFSRVVVGVVGITRGLYLPSLGDFAARAAVSRVSDI